MQKTKCNALVKVQSPYYHGIALAAMLTAGAPTASFAGLFGSGDSDQYFPDSVQSGTPAVVEMFVHTYGAGGPAKNRYTDIALHCAQDGETSVRVILPQATELPENLKKATKDGGWEGFIFTLPSYTGKESISCYIDMKFDGYTQSKTTHLIKLVPPAAAK